MAHIEPLEREDLAEFEPGFQMVEQMMGFVQHPLTSMPHGNTSATTS